MNNNFYKDVIDVVMQIPFGRVTNYGSIAKFLNKPYSSRLVGWVLNSTINKIDIPAHRVVNKNGVLTGKLHFGENDEMQKLLESENMIVKNDIIIDFKQKFWEPSTELL